MGLISFQGYLESTDKVAADGPKLERDGKEQVNQTSPRSPGLPPLIITAGYCGLGRAVESLGLATTSEVELDFVVASLGSVNNDLISAIYNAAQGQSTPPSDSRPAKYLLDTRR